MRKTEPGDAALLAQAEPDGHTLLIGSNSTFVLTPLVLDLVTRLREAIPDLSLTTDLIVGFPGERDEDFAEGLAFVEEMRFTHAHLFPFSAREGTAAASFGDQLSTEVKRARLQQMQAVVTATGQVERSRFVGTTRPVLFEGDGKPLADEPGRLWFGLTDNYLRVATVVPEDADLHNMLAPVQLATLAGDVMHGKIESSRY